MSAACDYMCRMVYVDAATKIDVQKHDFRSRSVRMLILKNILNFSVEDFF